MKILDFKLDAALNGASIALVDDDTSITDVNKKVLQYILYFKKSDINSIEDRYVGIGQTDNIKYYFKITGELESPTIDKKKCSLKIVEDEIKIGRGTTASRGDGSGKEETIQITSLEPRELFAQTAMAAIIGKMNRDVLSMDDYAINNVCELSFKIAQAMINKAAEKRAKTPEITPEPKPGIDVDKDSLNSESEKILYNMSESIKTMEKSIRTIESVSREQQINFNKLALSTQILSTQV